MNLMTSYTEKYNNEYRSVELYFSKIPSKEEREELKNNKYKYHSVKRCWYKRQEKKEEIKEDIKLESIYYDLTDAIKDDVSLPKLLKLKEKLEQKIREDICYKTTPKTRVNAIKRVASKNDARPALTGYGILDDYKCITDSYHAVMIHEENLPLKLVTTDKELIEKYGKENCISGTYPDFTHIIPDISKDYEKVEIDFDDIEQFYKLHKKNSKEETYKVKELNVDINYLKNVVDILGKDTEMYVPTNDYRPIVLINKDNEKGIVLPIKVY